jgi:beta-glucosidase
MTVFPQSVTLAASFNSGLLYEVAEAISVEARASYNAYRAVQNKTGLKPPGLSCFSPQINIVRDPRWGRAQETYGECPRLTATLAREYVRGLQGNAEENNGYLRAIATPKHFNACT